MEKTSVKKNNAEKKGFAKPDGRVAGKKKLFIKSVVFMEKEFVLMSWIEDRVFGYIEIPGQVPEPV
ncbi:hypothetical protein Tco_1116035, partial [Tanacetum coccineum]